MPRRHEARSHQSPGPASSSTRSPAMAASPSSYDAIVVGAGTTAWSPRATWPAAAAGAGARAPRTGRRRLRDRGDLSRLQGLDRCLRQQPLPHGDRPRPAAARHGFEVLPRNPSSFTPLPDGRSLTLGPDPGDPPRDRQVQRARRRGRYPQYEAMLERVAAVRRADARHDPARPAAPPGSATSGSC